MPYFQAGHTAIYYRELGQGQTALVFLHGWYQNGQQAFAGLIPYLARKYRLFIPDLPGHGLSDGVADGLSCEDVEFIGREFLQYVRRHYRCRKIFLVGHSFGAFLSLKLAVALPQKLDGIIAISALDSYASYSQQIHRLLWLPYGFWRIYLGWQALLGHFPYGDRQLLYANSCAELIPDRWQYAQFKDYVFSPANARRYLQALLDAKVPWPEKKLSMPICLIYGKRDFLTPPNQAQAICPHCEQVEVHVLEDAGHNVQRSAAEQVAALADGFITLFLTSKKAARTKTGATSR